GEARIADEAGEADILAEPLKGRIVGNRQYDEAVAGRKYLVGHDVRMLVAEPGRVVAGREIVHTLVRKPRHVGVEHADVDLVSLSGSVAVAQRRQYPDAAVEAREQVGERNADLLWQALRFAGQAHDATHGLDQAVVTGAFRIGSGLSEAGDRAVDQ